MKKLDQGKADKEINLSDESTIKETKITDDLSVEDLNEVQGGVAPILGPIK